MRKKLLGLILLLAFLPACAHQAVFLSDPPGAGVYVDGKHIGETPCTYEYSMGTGGSYDVRIERVGFEPVLYSVQADQVDSKARNKWLAAGLVWSPLWVGTFFTKRLKTSYEFMLKEDIQAVAVQVSR